MTVLSWLRHLLGRTSEVPAKAGLSFGRSLTGAGKHILLDDATLRSHVSISGRVGAGVSVLVEQLLTQQTEQGRGWVYIDPACDQSLLERLAAAANAQGRGDEFYVLDLGNPQNSNTYDVLRAGTPEERAIRALQVLPGAGNNPGAEFYAQQCYAVLVPVLSAVDAAGKTVGLYELGVLLSQLESESGLRELLDAIPAGHAARDALLAALEPLQSGKEGEALRLKQVLGGLVGRLIAFGSAAYTGVINNTRPEIDFADILAHNKMCYVRLPPIMGKDSTVLALARMVAHDVTVSLNARAYTPRRLRETFLFVMDAFPAYGLSGAFQAPIRNRTYSNARGLKVALVPVMTGMSFGRLNEIYSEDEVDTLIGNTFTKVYFHQPEDELTKVLHPDMPTSTLENLTLGEFAMWKGATGYRGLLSSNAAAEPARAFTKRDMWPHEERARMQLMSVREDDTA